MDAPICRICGQKHWSRVCSGGETPAVTKRPPTVTKSVTKAPAVTTPLQDASERRETIKRLQGEVARLKEELAAARRSRPRAALTGAERVRRHREKKKLKLER